MELIFANVMAHRRVPAAWAMLCELSIPIGITGFYGLAAVNAESAVLPGTHVLHQFLRDHLLFEKHRENKTDEELFNPLEICGVYFRHGEMITFPVPAGVSNQGMDMEVPVGHSPEGLRYKNAAEEDIIAIKGFLKKHGDRVPGTPAELW